MKHQECYLHVMSIVHGKSELCICASMRSNLKIRHEIIAKDKGKHSIQVTSVLNELNDSRFKSYSQFIRAFPDVQHSKGKLINFKLFILMDLDDCTEAQAKLFCNKKMFSEHWLYEYIVPIYSTPNLEAAMKKIGIPVHKHQKERYITIFPTNHGDLDITIAKDFYNRFKPHECTNIEIYLEYCLKLIGETL